HAHTVLLDRFGGVDRDLVVGLVALLHPEVEIDEIDVEVGMDQLVLAVVPDDPGHLVAVELDDRIAHLDLRHEEKPSRNLWKSGTGTRGLRLSPNPAPTGAAIAPGPGQKPP